MSSHIRILLVEDNPGDARLVREMLHKRETAPFELEEVDRLSAAFEKLREKSYDIMLLDLGLPDSQGLETMQKVRSLAANMPIIILTGMADETIGMQAIEQGAQDFLVKWEASETLLTRSIRYAIERKQIDEALRHSEKRYHSLFEGMMGVGALIGVACDSHGNPSDFRYIDVNRSFEQISDRQRDEIIGKKVSEILPRTKDGWYENCGRTAISGESARFLYYCPDLQRHFDYSIYSPEKGQAAVIGWDISDQVNAIRALHESEERLELAVDGASLGLWDWVVETDQVVFNKRAVEILGYSPDELPADFKSLSKLVHPDDISNSRKSVMSHLKESSPLLELESRILTRTGQWRWIQVSGRVVERSGDKPLRAAGIIRDISDMIEAHAALRESEERYRMIVETSGEGILIVNADDITTFVNQQMADMLGYTVEEMIGRSMFDFMNEEGQVIVRGRIERRKMGIKEQYDFKYRRKDGGDFWAIISTTPLHDGEGHYRGSLKMVTDINERKKGEIREKARFVLLSRLRNAKSIDECLIFGCKAIAESMLFAKSAYIYYDEQRNVVSFGQHGLEKGEANAIKKSLAPSRELLAKVSQLKYRISKSYFVPEGSVPEIQKGFPNISGAICDDGFSWKTGDVLFTPIVTGDKSEGLAAVACPFSTQRPPSHDFILRLEELVDMVLIRAREIRHSEELARERQALSEKNVALKEIMSVIEAEKMEIRQQIAGMIDQVLKPAVNRLVRRDGTVNKTYFDLLKYNLDELSAATGGALHFSSKLSPREMEICAMIKNGASSKDIAEALDIALVTVQKHREVIRKKLGLTNKNINLTTHLRNM